LKVPASINAGSTRELSDILKWARALDESVDEDELLSRFIPMINQVTAAEKVALLLCDEDSGFSLRVVATGESVQLLNQPTDNNTQLPIQLVEYAKNTADVVNINTQCEAPVFDSYLSASRLSSVLCLPVVIRNKVAAVLYLDHLTKRDAFSVNVLPVLNFLCYHAVNYIQASAPVYERKTAETDVVTDLILTHQVIENVPVMIYHHIYESDGSTFYTEFVNSKCKEMYGIIWNKKFSFQCNTWNRTQLNTVSHYRVKACAGTSQQGIRLFLRVAMFR